MRSRFLSTVLLCVSVAPAAADTVPFFEPNAILVNLTEADLNRIVRDAFHARGASRIEGAKHELSRGVTDLCYRAGLAEPVVTLHRDGLLRLELTVLDAELTIGSIERKLLMRRTRCENAGVSVDPGRPVGLRLALRLVVDDHDLRVVPEEVALVDREALRLRKPTRCRNNPLPEFLLWWIGKSRLRREIAGLDDVLLAKAREGAAALREDEGLLARHWRLDEGRETVHLYPSAIDTDHGSLLIALAGSSPVPHPATGSSPDWYAGLSDRSFLGLSESFLNFALRTAFREFDGRPRRPSGSLRKLFRSESVYALIPGLRGMENTDGLRLGFRLHAPPSIEFAAGEGGLGGREGNRAVIHIGLSGVELTLTDSNDTSERWLGSVDVESAAIAIAPHTNVLGGISFDVIENDWRVSSRGIEFDEQILAATFQELFFGEIFETSYEPVGRNSFDVGETSFEPRYFSLVGHHLVIGLTGP
jgi:hypothetical protein